MESRLYNRQLARLASRRRHRLYALTRRARRIASKLKDNAKICIFTDAYR